MFNIGPGEIIIVALVLLMAVGPEQLPGVIRRAGKAVSQVRSMTEGLRSDFMAGMDEIERATDPNSWAGSAGPSGDDKPPKKHSAVMTATEASALADADAEADAATEGDDDSPVDDATADNSTTETSAAGTSAADKATADDPSEDAAFAENDSEVASASESSEVQASSNGNGNGSGPGKTPEKAVDEVPAELTAAADDEEQA